MNAQAKFFRPRSVRHERANRYALTEFGRFLPTYTTEPNNRAASLKGEVVQCALGR